MYPEIELLSQVKTVLERLGIFYFVTGSIASSSYGEPRTTNDVDIIALLHENHIVPLCNAFKFPEFYISEEAVRDAVATHFQFNILHQPTGYKIGIIVLGDTEFDRTMAGRTQRIEVAPGMVATLISPEDVILNKLLFYLQGQSDKHLRDIAGILRVSEIDHSYIARWADKLGLTAIWEIVLKREKDAP